MSFELSKIPGLDDVRPVGQGLRILSILIHLLSLVISLFPISLINTFSTS